MFNAATLAAALFAATLSSCTDMPAAQPGDAGVGGLAPATLPVVLADAGDDDCGMREAFIAADANTPGGRAPVWGPAEDPARGPAMFAAPLNVNTDGTRRSYSVDDPAGRSFAFNNVCNAMAGYCRGLSPAAREARFALLRQARDQGWPPDLLPQTQLSSNVVPRAADGRVCPELEVGGRRYLVSATALADPRAGGACAIDRYVDALTVPALVLQGGTNGFTRRGVRVGDAVVAWRPGLAAPVYAVAGDTGPAERLGEGSIALNGALLGRVGEPSNYLQVRAEYVVPRAYVLVFPGTRDATRPRVTADRIEASAREAFSAWGGGSEARAFARLRTCAAAIDRR